MYNRTLSDSEIKAIYTYGTNGKFNPFQFSTSPAQSVAQAQVTLPGITNVILFGANTNWQTNTVTFVATNAATPLVITGLEPGMLLDAVTLVAPTNQIYTINRLVTNAVVAVSNLYYLPEQSLDPLLGTSAYGLWQLEIQDDRVGATNHAVLDSWALQFIFAHTNPVPVIFNGGVTNFLPAGGLAWYEVDVPTNADFATNILTFATGPLNMWFSTNVPPTITNAPGGDVQLLSGSTGGSAVLGTNGYPGIIPGGTYYIGIQNPGASTVQYGFQVVFHLFGPSLQLPAQTNVVMNELTTLLVANTAIVNYPGATLAYKLVNPPNWASINTNGIIKLSPLEPDGPGVYTITTIVTDTNAVLSATNSFTVIVNEINTPPFFLVTPPDQYVNAFSKLTVTNLAADTDYPPNLLTYSLIGAPAGMSINPVHGVITWTPTAAQAPSTNLVITVVTDTNPPAINAKSLSATNFFTVYVAGVIGPFAFTQPAQLVTGASAQLNGMATPNGVTSKAWFQWGTNTLYGSNTPPVSVGAGYNVVYVTNKISSLTTNLPYHFRLVVSNALTMVYGFDQVLDEANVVVWGANFSGQKIVPPGLSNVVAIAGAYDHSLALKNDGTAVGWGDNSFNQATVPGGLNNNLVAVAGGEYYSMALKNSGAVVAWGANVFPGQTNVPPGLNNVVAIAGGTYSSLALKNDGSVVAWGANFAGQTNVPTALSNVVAVAGGSFHSLAIKNDGTVVAWGDNGSGQTNVPTGLSNVVAIASGSSHSLALKNDGTVVAWGDNVDGQTNVPPGLSNVVAIAAGGFHSLALKNDGSTIAWGDSSAGQTNVPVGLSNVVAIAAGNLHSLALTPYFNVNPINPIVLNLSNGVPQTSTIGAGGMIYYQVSVPVNGDFSTNRLLFADGPLNVWFTGGLPPSPVYMLLGGVTNGVSVLSPSSVPTNIVPGSIYYLGVQNTNNFSVTFGIQVDFHLVTSTNVPPFTNAVPISSIVHTNIGGMNGFLLTWFAPSNALFQVQWQATLGATSWNTFTNIIGYNASVFTNPTNTQFNFFDDGSQTGGFDPTRFYRLITISSGSANTPPVLASQTNRVINPLNPLTVVNTATDSDVPTQTLTYTLTSTVTGTNLPVITNGIITWTPDISQAGTSNLITTVVTDNGVPPLSATNSFSVIVNPVPGISSLTYSNGFLLAWFAPTNDIFQVQVATSLAFPINWQTFTNIITYTGPLTPTNGLFGYYDDGSQYPFGPVRFYQLKLIGITPPATPTIAIGSIVSTNGNILLTWLAPTNDQFNVRWATNLLPPVTWTAFPGTITSTNGTFTFTDTNTPLLLKFYDLILLP